MLNKYIYLSATACIVLIISIIFYPYSYNRSVKSIFNQNINSNKNTKIFEKDISLNDIFKEDHLWTATLSAQNIIKLYVTGDVIPARSVNNSVVKYNNPMWPFENVYKVVKDADILMINLESPLIDNCKPTVEGMIFCGSPKNIDGLTFLGVDVAGIANNHISNYGSDGIIQTKNLLNKNNISVPGTIDDPVIKTIKGVRFAFLAFNDIGGNDKSILQADPEIIKEYIGKAKEKADVVITSFHWGVEYTNKPNERQTSLGHLAIDQGSDLVIGNHPHWVQPVEIYKGKPIMYAHGNFVFDQMWSEETKKGVLGMYTFYKNKLIDVEFLPIYIKDYGQPYFLENGSKKDAIKYLENISNKN